jgi:hypothetical protein
MKQVMKHLKVHDLLSVVVHAYNPSTSEAEIERSKVQGQPREHSKFKSSLNYMVKHSLK